MSLIDAVLPDIVATRHTLLHNRSMKPDINIKLEDGHYSHVNSMGHGEIMDIDGTVNDVGNNKALLLKGHESEVGLTVIYEVGNVYLFSIESRKHQWKFGRVRNGAGSPVGTEASTCVFPFKFSQTSMSVFITQ